MKGYTPRQYTPRQLAFIKKHRRMLRRDLHAAFVATFPDRPVSLESIKALCVLMGWPSGRTGRNRRHHPIGTEIESDRGYLIRKVCHGSRSETWKKVHLLNWEKVHGPRPAGHVLKCLDGNKLNVDPSNWKLISISMLGHLNSNRYDRAPVELKPTILATAELKHALSKVVRRDVEIGRK